jgi:hypothetical protein
LSAGGGQFEPACKRFTSLARVCAGRLHVDYWDRLGWKDPFASSEWTKRQKTYAENWKAESVYTPAFVLNGREWRNTTIPVVNDAAPGVLKATVQDSNAVMISFAPANGSSEKFDVYLARLGFGIAVNVRAGENNGRSLKHDFVGSLTSSRKDEFGSAGTSSRPSVGISESSRTQCACRLGDERGRYQPASGSRRLAAGDAMTGIRLAIGCLGIASR